MYKGPNRRKYKRAKKVFTLSLRARSDEANKTVSASWDTACTIDLSVGGVLIHHNKNLIIGSSVDLKINISEFTSPINCVGKIIRIEKEMDSIECDIAIMFTAIGVKEKDLINKIVEESSE